jgi:hypothetical protein
VSNRLARAAYFLVAPLVCLVIFRRVLSTWFLFDDFSWLSLRLEVYRLGNLWHVLFRPEAEGTVRFLSERLFFVVFSSIFGLHPLPYRLWVLGTWFADLTLASLIGARITGSRAAGLLAALLWTISLNVLVPLAWTSAYNEVLCAAFILGAFYARLRWLQSGGRKWIALEWAAYLAGFGALEIIVMYPVVAALHALCFARKRVWSTVPLFVPAALFTAIHFRFIPKSDGPYKLALDHRLPATLWTYVIWSIGPSRLGNFVGHGRTPGLIATALIGVALAAYLLWSLRRRDLTVVFYCGWFVTILAPVLLLPDHLEDFYATIPMLGLAWMGAQAIVSGWRAGGALRAVAVILPMLYFAGSIRELDSGTHWYHDRSIPIRKVMLAMRAIEIARPGTALLLQGVDNDLIQSGLQRDAFRVIGAAPVYFIGSGDGVDPDGRYRISTSQALVLLERGEARALDVSSGEPRDVTGVLEQKLRGRSAP